MHTVAALCRKNLMETLVMDDAMFFVIFNLCMLLGLYSICKKIIIHLNERYYLPLALTKKTSIVFWLAKIFGLKGTTISRILVVFLVVPILNLLIYVAAIVLAIINVDVIFIINSLILTSVSIILIVLYFCIVIVILSRFK